MLGVFHTDPIRVWLLTSPPVALWCCFLSEEQPKEEKEEEEPLAGKDEEERRIAEMGRPMLGDHVKLEIIIEESYEFKVSIHASVEPLFSLCLSLFWCLWSKRHIMKQGTS